MACRPHVDGLARKLIFVGVTTGQSSIMRIFPRWTARLGLGEDIQIQGCDLPLHAPAQRYRQVVLQVRDDPNTVGAIVTSHKMDLYAAARDLFDELDEPARLLGEVSSLALRDGRLWGWARDSVAAGRAFERLPGPGSGARTPADVLCFGAGGAGQAIAFHLLTQTSPQPAWRRIILTDRDPERLDRIQRLRRRLSSPLDLMTVQTGDPRMHDDLMASLPDGSLVINATGMGKDLPGSPVTERGQFPRRGIAWDLNYRGERQFLQQASRQAAARDVRVADGWEYFIDGWTAAMEAIFDRPISRAERDLLAADAHAVRYTG
jgi:shikimate 5-dehydrogenase